MYNVFATTCLFACKATCSNCVESRGHREAREGGARCFAMLHLLLSYHQQLINPYIVVLLEPFDAISMTSISNSNLTPGETQLLNVSCLTKHGCSFPTSGQFQNCARKGIRRQGIALTYRNSLQKSLCPVVICPYLCSSDNYE